MICGSITTTTTANKHYLTHLSNLYLGDPGSYQGSIEYQKRSLTPYKIQHFLQQLIDKNMVHINHLVTRLLVRYLNAIQLTN